MLAAVEPGAASWSHRAGAINLDRPLLMGILNITPDSFSDGGCFNDPHRALERAQRMVEDGAGVIDVGGESTRPGAAPVDPAEEMTRVLPVLRLLRANLSIPISIDTRRAAVARAAMDEGADIVNDVSALDDPDMATAVAEAEAALVLMHMRGTPATMQNDPTYFDVAGEVTSELHERLERAIDAGVSRQRIVVDPGIGFGKNLAQNLELIAGLGRLRALGRPILLGSSRKSFLGRLIGGAPPEERVAATIGACVAGLLAGARVFRVHDVAPVRDALIVADAIRAAGARA